MPSLYRLHRKQRLPKEVRIVGVSRSPYTDDSFRQKMAAALKEFAADDFDEADWRAFAERVHYVAADAAKPGGLDPLRQWLQERAGPSLGRRLYYLAVSATLFGGIVEQL